jgi:hypothetical protein
MAETTLLRWTIGAALALVAAAVAAEPMGEATRYVSTVGGRGELSSNMFPRP